MFEVKACRGCLNTDCRLEKISHAFRRILPSLVGFEIKDGDGYPQYLCVECHTQVKKALAFRRKCRRADFVMKEIMAAKKQVCLTEIYAIDRKKSNLISSLEIAVCRVEIDIWPENCENGEEKIEEEEEEEEKKFEEYNLEEIDTEVDREDLDDNEEELHNIDLNDVFKDLKEDEVEEESGKEEQIEVQEKIEVEDKKKKTKSNFIKPRSYKAFEHAKINYVPEKKQIANFELRKNSEPFKSAQLKCALCVTVFDQYKSLFYHVKDGHPNMPDGHSCSICKRSFKTEEELLTHKAHTHWYEYTSELCDCTHYTLEQHIECYESQMEKRKEDKRRWPTRDLEIHLSFRKAPLSQEQMASTLLCADPYYQCKVCSMGFKEKKVYTSHEKIHMLKKFHFICDVCGVRFLREQSLCVHVKNNHMYSYTCKHCDLVFMNRSLAWYHITRDCTVCHHYKNRRGTSNALCSLCGKMYKTRSQLLSHFSTRHLEEMFVNHCVTCGISFKYLHELVRHQLNQHDYIRINDPCLGSEEFSCSTCSVRFVNKRAHDTHVVKFGHDGAQDVPLACASCKLFFKDEDQMSWHVQNICKITRYPQKCAYCEQILNNKDEYMSHYRTKHKGDYYRSANPYTRSIANAMCELCGKTFTAPQLKSHILHMHSSKPWPYLCKKCKEPRGFDCATRMFSHILANHSHRPYHCTRCPVHFRTRCECRDHILKVHAPVRPYTCGVCARTFAHLDYLHEHSVQAHRLHVKKAGKNVYLPNKMRGFKIAVYPDMKINVSRVDKRLLKDVEVYLCDYMDENLQLVPDNTEHFIFEPSKKTPKLTRGKRGCPKEDTPKTTKRKRSINKEDTPKKTKRKRDINKDTGPQQKRKKTKDEVQICEDTKDEVQVCQDTKDEVQICEETTDEILICEDIEDVKQGSEVFSRLGESVLDEAGNEYKVLIRDGTEHVLIDGVLYKLDISA